MVELSQRNVLSKSEFSLLLRRMQVFLIRGILCSIRRLRYASSVEYFDHTLLSTVHSKVPTMSFICSSCRNAFTRSSRPIRKLQPRRLAFQSLRPRTTSRPLSQSTRKSRYATAFEAARAESREKNMTVMCVVCSDMHRSTKLNRCAGTTV